MVSTVFASTQTGGKQVRQRDIRDQTFSTYLRLIRTKASAQEYNSKKVREMAKRPHKPPLTHKLPPIKHTNYMQPTSLSQTIASTTAIYAGQRTRKYRTIAHQQHSRPQQHATWWPQHAPKHYGGSKATLQFRRVALHHTALTGQRARAWRPTCRIVGSLC